MSGLVDVRDLLPVPRGGVVHACARLVVVPNQPDEIHVWDHALLPQDDVPGDHYRRLRLVARRPSRLWSRPHPWGGLRVALARLRRIGLGEGGLP